MLTKFFPDKKEPIIFKDQLEIEAEQGIQHEDGNQIFRCEYCGEMQDENHTAEDCPARNGQDLAEKLLLIWIFLCSSPESLKGMTDFVGANPLTIIREAAKVLSHGEPVSRHFSGELAAMMDKHLQETVLTYR